MAVSRSSWHYWLPPAVWACIILVGTSLPRLPRTGIEGFDKVSHLIAYGMLGLLLMRSLADGRGMRLPTGAIWTILAGGIFGALDELHQGWIPGRTPDAMDFVADLAGLMLGVAAWGVFSLVRRSEGQTQNRKDREMTQMAEALHLDQASFTTEILESDQPALVDFWAPWCGPCQMMGPTIDKLAGDYAGKAKVGKINVDDSPDLASKYGVRSIPALLFFKNGELVDQFVGVQSEDALKQKLDSLCE
jgi:thioredoxin 1